MTRRALRLLGLVLLVGAAAHVAPALGTVVLVALVAGHLARRRRHVTRKGPLPAALRRAVLAQYRYTCVFCGYQGRNVQVDHVRPRAAGGTSDPRNLAVLCKRHNMIKSDFWPGHRYHPWPGYRNPRMARDILRTEQSAARYAR